MQHYAAFHLGLHCLQSIRLGVSRAQRVKAISTNTIQYNTNQYKSSLFANQSARHEQNNQHNEIISEMYYSCMLHQKGKAQLAPSQSTRNDMALTSPHSFT